jgi:outer membrane beta-barrel protein
LGFGRTVSQLGPATPTPANTLRPNQLDGVAIEAVETFVNPLNSEISFNLGFFPFNAYYAAFSGQFGYTYHYNSDYAWEILNAGYALTSQKALTAELANTYGVNPDVIEKVTFLVASNFLYTPIYGKTVLTKKFIRYMRISLLAGPAVVGTSIQTLLAFNFGLQFDTYINEKFSWKLEFRDYVTFLGFRQYASFNVGVSMYF